MIMVIIGITWRIKMKGGKGNKMVTKTEIRKIIDGESKKNMALLKKKVSGKISNSEFKKQQAKLRNNFAKKYWKDAKRL